MIPCRPTPLPLPAHLVSWQSHLASQKIPPVGMRDAGGMLSLLEEVITIATNPL